MRPMCCHCGREIVTRPRGLGWKCYYTPGLRERYGVSPHPAARRETPDGFRAPPPCPEPTAARPGTSGKIAGKIAAMAARCEAGVSLWHPADGLQPERSE